MNNFVLMDADLKKLNPIFILALAPILYWVCHRAYYVGFFNDDAFYIIGARSLLQGRYAELNQPGTPPLINYMPGYPLLLAPLVFLFPAALLPLQLFSVVMAGLMIFFFSKLIDGEAGKLIVFFSIAVAAFNPLTVSLSAQVLSDIPFALFQVLTFLWARRFWESDDWRGWFVAAGLAGFSTIIRPAGLAIGVAMALALFWERRFKTLGIFFLFLAAFVLPVAAPQTLRYASEYRSSYIPIITSYYFNEVFFRNFLRWPASWSWLRTLTVIGGIYLTVAGARSFGFSGWRRSLLIYFILYAIAHIFWSKESGRYIYPVFPFVAFFIFRGMDNLVRRKNFKNWAVIGLGGVVFLCYARPLNAIIQASLFKPNAFNTAPAKSVDWVRAHTAASDIFATELDGQFFLLTGRQVFHLPKIYEPDRFYLWIKANKVRYVWASSNAYLMHTHRGNTLHDPYPFDQLSKVLNRPSLYEPVFSSEEEGTAIYRVRENNERP